MRNSEKAKIHSRFLNHFAELLAIKILVELISIPAVWHTLNFHRNFSRARQQGSWKRRSARWLIMPSKIHDAFEVADNQHFVDRRLTGGKFLSMHTISAERDRYWPTVSQV